ncbi:MULTISPECIES: SDR family NAD(P)-dependent oxidoreductase [Acidiphilium]|uniref:SDR family NAD(P)-dependent oxidoreductase n=1 Tax=Acidiphilium TaxID=522 RepID=UPI001B8AF9CA|nr:SDR family NAD(P)-dependent oxidoreductase [Acidiphilium sp.]MBS3025545.1 SDR family NAD(P)-dependent oxidoreductase [Acidiphilium multivorum]MBU6357410.1 SDR family NAD(P)-dependent oxidoreductase [Rhodospirillales bacterium]
MASEPSCLIIGASRGLGLAMAEEYLGRGWRVTATVRGAGPTGLHALAARAGGRLAIERLDINDADQLAALRARLEGQVFDQLFVNAGIASDPAAPIGAVSTETFVELMVTNALSPMRAVEALGDLVAPEGGIGLMSSGLGSVANNTTGMFEAYRASKAALNTLMRSYAARHRDSARSLALVAPGWVRTDMGGPQATLSIGESIPRVVDQLIARRGTPGLAFFDYTGAELPW